MGFLKDFFLNFENLLLSIIYFDYSKTLLLLIICMLVALIHVSISRRKYKKYVKNITIDIKRINAEANYKQTKKTLIKLYFFVFIFLSLIFVMKDNLNIFIPVITGLIVLLIFSLKEQLNNIFLGILFKSPINTTIHEGLEFYFKDKPNETFKIVKINLFKSILKNDKTGKIESIENKDLNLLPLIHKPLKDLSYITFKYIIPNELNVENYKKRIEDFIKSSPKNEAFDFSKYREIIFDLKEKYNSTPFLKPFYDIEIIPKDKDSLELILNLTLYDYDYQEYLKDYFLLNPNNDLKN